jgi:alpha-beta hydrolase superfamily lysophospholipase
VKKESGLAGLPVFLFGLSMGGATVVKMALRNPLAYRGLVLYAPM